MPKLTPVILSGGAGTRLWPLSRPTVPKQFLPLLSDRTLLQETALRTADHGAFNPLIAVCNADHRFLVAEQLRQVGLDDAVVVLEPVGRNTAPAALVATLLAHAEDPDGMVLLMPADHAISDVAAFQAAIEAGRAAAEAGYIVLLGIPAAYPEPGYGYIQRSKRATSFDGVFPITCFTEKPDRRVAQRFCREGRLWNSGIFLFSAATMIAEFERLEPEMLARVRASLSSGARDSDFLRLDPGPFEQVRSVAIDRAIMERTSRGVVVPADIGWTDVGTWSALWDVASKDAQMNVLRGNVHVEHVSGSYVRSDGPTVAAVGVNDVIVVASPQAVLVLGKAANQDLRALIERLQSESTPPQPVLS